MSFFPINTMYYNEFPDYVITMVVAILLKRTGK